VIGCGCALVAALCACGRIPASDDRHNPIEDPVPSAEAGNLSAQYELAVRVANGAGVRDPPAYAYAAEWAQRAADRGHPAAQAMLGVMCHRGQGVPQDDVEAYKWLTLAIRQQPAERDAFALWRDFVARDMTPAQVAEGQHRASEWHVRR
jgi:hypothetical protein